MILRPEQIRLMRLGCPVIPANGESESSSSADQATQTTNTDKRIVNESGIVATEGARVTANIERVDADIVNHALDTVGTVDAINGQNVSKLLDTGAAGFSKLLDVVDKFNTKTQDTASSMAARYQSDVLDAYSRAQADKAGGIDQKTMIVIGVTAATALVMINRKRG